ncbi:MAG: thiamine pyrophosphate-requiring protein [Alphaproteobacteria bacterium]
MNGADVIAEILKREGTEFLSCYPRNPVIDAAAAIGIRTILCRQERVGVGIADGYSRIKRGKRNGVFAAQQGPGIENAFAGIAQAYSENVPLLVIPSGFPPRRRHIRPTFAAADVLEPVTKWQAMAYTVQEIPDVMRRAYHAMRSGKPGPVLVEVPTDVFDGEFKGQLDYEPVPVTRAAPDPAAVTAAAKLLLAAKAPVIWAGQGIHYAEAGERLAALAELLPAPVACTNPGKSAIPDAHPLSLGASTRMQPKMYSHYLGRADVVMAIGSSLTRTSFGPAMPPGKRIIHSTNEVSDINKDYRAEQALVGDAALVIEALIAEIGRQRGKGSAAAARNALESDIAAIKKSWLEEWDSQLSSDETPINQYRVIRDLMRTVDAADTIVTHDSGSPRKQLLPFWQTKTPGSYMGWGKSTQLGYGLGITMGAKLAAPEKFCINVMGDCAIGMTGMDLETASRNEIAILTLVFNNGVMAAERHTLPNAIRNYDALAVRGNYAKLADALNVASRRVETPRDIVPAIEEGLAANEAGKPFLLEFMVKEGYEFSDYPY